VSWRLFWKVTMVTAAGIAAAIYAVIVVVDPYDTVFFSPPFERAPVTSNQRYSFPALARKSKFDSAIVGTSTTRLLRPARFNELFGARFVNVSMNSGTAYEQSRILDLFVRSHPNPRFVVFGLDTVWCDGESSYRKFTERPFPPWMYDDNRWNDLLHLFDLKTIEQVGLQVAYLTGLHEARRGLDGYTNFLPPRAEYDIARARTHIYGGTQPLSRAVVKPARTPSAAERAAWRFPAHPLLKDMLASLPPATVKILMFVPYHAYLQPAAGSLEAARWRECKQRIVAMAGGHANTHVLDFMIDSQITRVDENYWDALHYSLAVADRLAELTARGVAERRSAPDLFDYLSTSGADSVR